MVADLPSIRLLAKNAQIDWSEHASQRIIERNIKRETVLKILLDEKNEVLETQMPRKTWQSERFAIFCDLFPDVVVLVTAVFTPSPHILIITVETPDDQVWNKNPVPPPTLVRR